MSGAEREAMSMMAADWGRDHDELSARIAELEAERKALCAAMNSAAGEIVNGAGRHKIANELLSPDAVRQWLKADDEACEKADRLETELDRAHGVRDDALWQRNEAREQARQLREAAEALAQLVAAEYPDSYTLAEIAATWGGEVLSDKEIAAIRAFDASREDGQP